MPLPFRANHLGSLLRPAELRSAHKQLAKGEIPAERYDEIRDRAIADVVAKQAEIGLRLVTDGEYRRASYWGVFVERVEGLATAEATYNFRDDCGTEHGFIAPYVTGTVRRTGPIALDEYAFLKSVTDLTGKITLPAPSSMHFWRGKEYAQAGTYESVEAFFADLAAVYREEIAELAAAGCTYIQLDEVAIAMLCDDALRERLAADGIDPEWLVDLYIQAINDALADRPAEMQIGLHLCRGNFKGRFLAEGGYEGVAEALFQKTDVDSFLLEYDNERAGDFAPLRLVPANKGVVLGLVSSKVPTLEELPALISRVEDAARFIDLDMLGVSPQCGFASTVAGNPVSEQDQWAKLARVVELAHHVWQTA